MKTIWTLILIVWTMILCMSFISRGRLWDFKPNVRYKNFSFDRLNDLDAEVKELREDLRHALWKQKEWREHAQKLIGIRTSEDPNEDDRR